MPKVEPLDPHHRIVCFWHIADVPIALMNVRFEGKADMARTCQYVR